MGNKIVDPDVVSAMLQLHLHSRLNTWLQYITQIQAQDQMRDISVLRFGAPYARDFTVVYIKQWIN